MATECLRSRSHSHRIHGICSGAKTMLLRFHRLASQTMIAISTTRLNWRVVFLATILCWLPSNAQQNPKRPRILGISEVHLYATNPAATRSFYAKVLDVRGPCHWCEEIPRSPMIVPLNDQQLVMLWSLPTPTTSDFLAQIGFATDDLAAMKRFLTAKGIAFSAPKGTSEISLKDPEGNRIAFTQCQPVASNSPLVYSGLRMIHAGFVVKDMAAENRFYIETLGFRLYWYGGFK